MRLKSFKKLFVFLFIIMTLYGCQNQTTTIELTNIPTPIPTTEAETYDLPYDIFFDFEINYEKDSSDLTQALMGLKDYSMAYNPQEIYNKIDDYKPDDYIEGGPLYLEDLEYYQAFDAYMSIDALFNQDIMFLISILDYSDIELGVLQAYNIDYYYYHTAYLMNIPDVNKNGDVKVMVLMGDQEIYADISLFSEDGELERRSIYHLVYDEAGIVELEKLEFDGLLDNFVNKNKFSSIDYTRGQGGTMISSTDYILGIKQFDITIIEADDSYSTYRYESSGQQMRIFKADMTDEYYFWTNYDEDIDYRGLSIYQDGIFKVRYTYSYNSYYENYSNTNSIQYNLKDINNVSYLEDRDLYYYDDQDQLQSMPYSNSMLSFHHGLDFYPTIEYKLDSEISKSLYEHPREVLEYDQVSYEELMTIWNNLDNEWDDFYLEDSQLNILDIDIDLGDVSIDVLPDLINDSFDSFINDIHEKYPDAIY